jgi:hypothetical protein
MALFLMTAFIGVHDSICRDAQSREFRALQEQVKEVNIKVDQVKYAFENQQDKITIDINYQDLNKKKDLKK